MTGADALVAGLLEREVDIVFGLPGVHNLPAWEALRASPIRLVGVRHEQAAAYAADGYARATGKVGVALVTTGPGAANCVTAIGEANASGSPVVLIATDIPSSLRRDGVVRGVLHETRDQSSLFRSVTKFVSGAEPGLDVRSTLTTAVDAALAPARGPVYVGIPTDLLSEPNGEGEIAWASVAITARGTAPEDRDEASAMIGRAKRPLVWAGGGARGAGEAVGGFAAQIGAPLLTTFGAAGLHPSAIFPPHVPEVGALWDAADLVIGVGTDFDGVDTQNWAMPRPPALLQIGVDARDAAKNWEPDHFVLLEASEIGRIAVERRAPWFKRPEVRVGDPKAAQLIAALDETLPADAAVVCDMCIPGYWIGGFRPTEGLQYPIGWGTLGFGFPASLGASLSGRTTVAICGDGGFLFACGELATAAQEQLPLTVLLFDDGGYGMLRHDGGDPFRLETPDFTTLARAFGVRAEQTTLEDLPARLRHHLTMQAPSMLVVQEALTPPPTTSPKWYRSRR